MDFTNPNEQAAVSKATLTPPPGARAHPRLRLGDMLVAQKVITSEQLAAALANQKRSGRRLGRILIEDGFSTEEVIARALALQLNVPYVELALNLVDTRVAKTLAEAQARRFRAMPIDDRGSALRLGMVDPSDYQSFDEIQRVLRRDIDLVVVTESRLNAVLDRIYSKSDQIVGLAREVEEDIGGDAHLGLAVAATQDEAPVAKLLQTLLDDAARSRASDIHIEPQERKLQIRFRVDGTLVVHTEAESRIAPAVLQKLKLIAGLDIAERRLPQDGRFVAQARSQPIDIRISTMPTQYGESAVLRLLPQHGGLLSLERIGMPSEILDKVRAFIHLAHGMLLVTGPTGSGKTTTLYGALAEMNSPASKIVTVEDPVEYRLPGITQVQVNDKIGLNFATVLRSTLRQDPDIVLVGEMRDRDTVDTGLRAAMTGHMVLSTLHTNDAASTPLRLLDMGAARFLVAASLRLVLAQRLVRAVCTDCRSPHTPTAQEDAFLRSWGGATDTSSLAHGSGCSHCNHTGFMGRLGVFELLEMAPKVVAALNSGETNAYLQAAYQQVGEFSLARHACSLVLQGKTTADEAMRLIGHSVEPS
ncbi:MAG TPA: ATPase, T2SS/T4P/T4SS family [Burkholderiaceae bacterium]|nr:ATPase, T2SS/T4P/T4SS family [Burkholderiaceae bacterium]